MRTQPCMHVTRDASSMCHLACNFPYDVDRDPVAGTRPPPSTATRKDRAFELGAGM